MTIATHRWKAAGVAVGTAALLTSTTAASACVGTDDTGLAPGLDRGAITAGDDDSVVTTTAVRAWLVAAESRWLDGLGALVDHMQAKVDALSGATTITPWQAEKLRHLIDMAGFFGARLAALPTTGPNALTADEQARVAALETAVAALRSSARAVLAGATVAMPAKPADVAARPAASAITVRTSSDPDKAGTWDGRCDHRWDGRYADRSFSWGTRDSGYGGDRYSGYRDGYGGSREQRWSDEPRDSRWGR